MSVEPVARPPLSSVPLLPPTIPPRFIWAANRFWMETENLKTGRYGGQSRQHW